MAVSVFALKWQNQKKAMLTLGYRENGQPLPNSFVPVDIVDYEGDNADTGVCSLRTPMTLRLEAVASVCSH